MPEANPPLPPRTTNLPAYDDLGFFAAQEVPYDCVEDAVEFIELLTENEFTPEQDALLNDAALAAKFGVDKAIERFGWLGQKSVYSGKDQALISGPSIAEDADADADNVFYLQNGNGEYLIKTDAGLGFSKADADKDKRLQIAKVVSIPYRWRRKGSSVSETRQTTLILCYNGPSH